MDCVLEPLRHPVHGERDEHNEPNNLPLAASACTCIATRVVAWVVLDVNGHEGDRVPRTECRGQYTTYERDQVHMTKPFGDIDGSPQHQHRERNPGNPGNEADDIEDGEDQEDNAARPVASAKHVDGRHEAEDDVEDTCGGSLVSSSQPCGQSGPYRLSK